MIELSAEHVYRVDGQILPGFSEIAKTMGLVKYFNCDPWFMERGTAIHEACYLHDLHILDWDTVDPRILGFVEAYILFQDETGIVCGNAETPLSHSTYRYCGKPDRFLPLIDIKGVQGYPIQLEAYAELLRANGYDPGRQGYMLHLKENGTYKLETHRFDRKLLGVFLSATSVFWYRKERGLI